MENTKELMLKKVNKWKGAWSGFGLVLILAVPSLLIYSIITGDWNWKYWAIWGVAMLFQRFLNAAFKKVIEQIKNEK